MTPEPPQAHVYREASADTWISPAGGIGPGHLLRFAPGSQRIIGLTIINAQHLLDRDGRLIATVPETVAASADDLAPAHAA